MSRAFISASVSSVSGGSTTVGGAFPSALGVALLVVRVMAAWGLVEG